MAAVGPVGDGGGGGLADHAGNAKLLPFIGIFRPPSVSRFKTKSPRAEESLVVIFQQLRDAAVTADFSS